MRIPIAVNLESRDGSVAKDAKITNGIVEVSGKKSRLRKRPGLSDYGLVRVGTAQLLTTWRGIRSVIGDYLCSGSTVSGSYTNLTAWNPSDKDADVTLSGSNLTAESAAAVGGVRSIRSHSSGLWYYETTIVTLGAQLIGFANSSQDLNDPYIINHISYSPETGSLFAVTSGYIPTGITSIAGDVIGCLYDADNRTVTFYKNGASIYSVGDAEIPTGAVYAFWMCRGGGAAKATAKFGATAFTYTPGALTAALTVTTANLPYSAAFNGPTAATQYLMIKNSEFGWTIATTGVATKIADVDYPGNMTPARLTATGIVYLDGYFFVMDTSGRIYNSALDDPTSWSALGFLTAQNEPGAGVALAKTQNYVTAFKEFSTELFYDAANPVGSPLLPVDNGFLKIGCASGQSVVTWNQSLIWMSQTKQAGRSVHIMSGLNTEKISTPDVDRILNADSLATVHAYSMRIDGHDLYLLTLGASDVTLVYDFSSKLWATWSSLTLGADIGEPSQITRDGTTATWIGADHGMQDGDVVFMSGYADSEYNGAHIISYISIASFSFQVTGTPTTPVAGTYVVKPYTESYFKFTKYTNYNGNDILLHESDGHLYNMQPSLYQDNAIAINYLARSQRIDGNTTRKKTMGRITLIGTTVSDTALVRWSDDDYATSRPYRQVDLSEPKPMLRRCGSFVDRSIEFRHTGNTNPILEEIELEVQ